MTSLLQERSMGLAGRTPDPIPTSNTDAVRAMSVGGGRFANWLTAALEVRGIRPEQSTRAIAAIQRVLSQTPGNPIEVQNLHWGSGELRGRIKVTWRPTRQDNAVSHANAMADLFMVAAQREFTPQSAFIMRRYRVDRTWPLADDYVYAERDFTPIIRETPPSEVPPNAPPDNPPPGSKQGTIEDLLQEQSGVMDPGVRDALIIGGIAAGALALGTFAIMAVRAFNRVQNSFEPQERPRTTKPKRSSRRARR